MAGKQARSTYEEAIAHLHTMRYVRGKQDKQKPWIEGGILPMQTQQHGDLSTKPAGNLKSGRVQTMYEGNDLEGQSSNNTEEMGDFNEMAALLESSHTPINIKRGDVVEGVIVRIDQDEILVDIGLKSEGVLSTKELPASGYGSFNELHIDDKVLVYVIQPETPDGHALLSLKRANAERQWRIAEEQYRNGELLQAKVIDYNKGGLIVDVNWPRYSLGLFTRRVVVVGNVLPDQRLLVKFWLLYSSMKRKNICSRSLKL